MVEAIEHFFLETVGRELCVFFCAMLPVIELRGAIPLAAGLGLPLWQGVLLAVAGNLLPVPFILLFIKAILTAMSRSKVGWIKKTASWLFAKAERNREAINRYAFWGLAAFVAIPLPGTGAWTGSLVAALFDMKFWRSFLAAVVGVLCAATIVAAISYGAVEALAWLL